MHQFSDITDVSKNKISRLPSAILSLTTLCTLSVKDNLLTELPQLMVLTNLTVHLTNLFLALTRAGAESE